MYALNETPRPQKHPQTNANYAFNDLSEEKLVSLFGEDVKQHSALIAAIYRMHSEFAKEHHTNMNNTHKMQFPELKIRKVELIDELILTLRGSPMIDTKSLCLLCHTTKNFDESCKSLSVDFEKCTTTYAIGKATRQRNYEFAEGLCKQTHGEEAAAAATDNCSVRSKQLSRRLCRIRMDRIISLYIQSDSRIPEFSVYLEETQEHDIMLLILTNVKHTSAAFMHELLRDPVANVCRVRACKASDSDAGELQLWLTFPAGMGGIQGGNAFTDVKKHNNKSRRNLSMPYHPKHTR